MFDLLKILVAETFGLLSPADNPNKENLFKLKKTNKKRLLIVSLTNSKFLINCEGLFAKYCNDAGYDVYFLTNPRFPRAISSFRFIQGECLYHNLLYVKAFLKHTTRIIYPRSEMELKNYVYNGVSIGPSVYSSVCRKLKLGQLDLQSPSINKLCRRYLRRSVIYTDVAEELVKKYKPDLVLANEKGYIASGEIFHVAVNHAVPFIQWVACSEPGTLVFKRYTKNNVKNHPHSISKAVWDMYKNNWKDEYTEIVRKMFERGYLEGVWFGFNRLSDKTTVITKEEFIKKYNLDPNKKIAVLFAHVMWDANLFYGRDLFEKGFEEWYVESIKAMAQNKEVNWVIKIHPANRFKHEFEGIKGSYREISAVEETFGKLPDNITFIYPEDEINPFALFQYIDYGLTVRGTVGSELPCFGVPVLTAGTGRYSGLGFTNDSNSKEEYLEKLKNISVLPRLSETERRLAIIHAYLFFKARPLPFTSIQEVWKGHEQDVLINLATSNHGSDFKKFSEWAALSNEEDLLGGI